MGYKIKKTTTTFLQALFMNIIDENRGKLMFLFIVYQMQDGILKND